MLVGLSATQIVEWMAYAKLEPFGEERADLRSAIVASTVANAFRGKGRAARVEDFMPKFDRPKRTNQELGAMFALFAKAHNAASRAKR